jgi:Zn-dependent protease with chaperone function
MIEVYFNLFLDNISRIIGLIAFLITGFLTLSEYKVYRKYNTSPEQFVLWLTFAVGSLTIAIFNDFVLGFLLGITILMVYETYQLRDAPVWGKLMLATTVSYMVILFGKIGQMVFDYITQNPGEDERIFATSFNIFIFVFFIMAFMFFGKQFVLVSRLSSPQMVYLFLFAFVYLGIARFRLRNIDYLNLNQYLPADRILFLTFGTYEILVLAMTFMYLISGWLLDVLFGVKKVTDLEVLAKVDDIAKQMGITEKLKVGYVQAPILNAFAYGPFMDKRIAFISSDLKDFKDSDIRGIVGHELAHASRHHTFLLLLLGVVEVGFKKALGLPASQLDYSFFDEGLGVSFFQYFLINYGIVILLYIFVRALEGHADKITKDAGFGEDLGKALFRLEGFYQGVASDFGISVNLLTNKQYTQAERERFTALAGRNIYQEFLKPKRASAFGNIFVSHPRTSYRITSLIRDDISPLRSAFLPYNILGLMKRKASIKMLNEVKDKAAELINTTYNEDYTAEALIEVEKYDPLLDQHRHLIGKSILAFNPLEKKVVEGVVSDISLTKAVATPIQITVNNENYLLDELIVKEYIPGEEHVLKNGKIIIPESYKVDEKKGLIITGEIDGKKDSIDIAKFGVPIVSLKSHINKNAYVYENGSVVLYKIDDMKIAETWADTEITITKGETSKKLKGKDIVIGFPPIGVQFRRDKSDDNLTLLNSLLDKKISFYTKDNYDVPSAGYVKSVDKEKLLVENRDGIEEVLMPKLEFLISYEYTIEIYEKEKLSMYDKFTIWWDNRNKFVYING